MAPHARAVFALVLKAGALGPDQHNCPRNPVRGGPIGPKPHTATHP